MRESEDGVCECVRERGWSVCVCDRVLIPPLRVLLNVCGFRDAYCFV